MKTVVLLLSCLLASTQSAALSQAQLKQQLDPTVYTFISQLASQGGKPLYKLSIEDAREVLNDIQSDPVSLAPADVSDVEIDAGKAGKVLLTIVKPKGVKSKLPAVIYVHGGGWILGNYKTHERLVRELAQKTNAAFVFVHYTPSPEAKYPVAIDQAYAATAYIAKNGAKHNLDGSRLAIMGDSVGGNMAAVITQLAKKKGPKILYQVLFYPVTDANFTTGSYTQFANGPWLTKPAMQWFWDAYEPNKAQRLKPELSPLRATVQQLSGLPPALIISDDDVLRDEVEAYARKLSQAGVRVIAVRFLGTIHDFVMLNPIWQSPPTRAAIDLAALELKKAFAQE